MKLKMNGENDVHTGAEAESTRIHGPARSLIQVRHRRCEVYRMLGHFCFLHYDGSDLIPCKLTPMTLFRLRAIFRPPYYHRSFLAINIWHLTSWATAKQHILLLARHHAQI